MDSQFGDIGQKPGSKYIGTGPAEPMRALNTLIEEGKKNLLQVIVIAFYPNWEHIESGIDEAICTLALADKGKTGLHLPNHAYCMIVPDRQKEILKMWLLGGKLRGLAV